LSLRGEWPGALQTALGPILGLLSDATRTEIAVNGPTRIYTKGTTWSGWRLEDIRGWKDSDDLLSACARLGDSICRTVNEREPIMNTRLPGGERVNVVVPPACAQISMTIRKFPSDTMTLDRLEELGSIAERAPDERCLRAAGGRRPGRHVAGSPLRRIFESLVLSRTSIIVAGGTNAGKTSLLNALSQVIPADERVVTIEDNRELQIQQPNWVALETVEALDPADADVSIEMLVKTSLRMTPDRIIVGEVRDNDALHLLRAFSTGHRGGFGTVHASSAIDALSQLQVLAQMASSTMQPQVVSSMVARGVEVVVYQEFFEDEMRRRVTEVIEVDRPGVSFASGGVEYRTRQLVQWDCEARCWTFPDSPSERLLRSLRRVGEQWPIEGGRDLVEA
jgi:pilus assembly protein CpaF